MGRRSAPDEGGSVATTSGGYRNPTTSRTWRSARVKGYVCCDDDDEEEQ